MSDLVLMPMTRKEFLNLDMGLRGRILERQSTLYLINESKDTKFRTELDAAKAREARLREALADSNRLLLAITLGPNYSDNEIRGQIYDNSKALEKVTP